MAVGALAEAAVDIVANLDTFEPDFRRQLEGAVQRVSRDTQKQFARAGKNSGEAFSKAAGQAASSAPNFERLKASIERLEQASVKAADSQADAAGRVRIAQKRLDDLREKSPGKVQQIIAAEEALARAQRNSNRAASALSSTTEKLAQARQRLFEDDGGGGDGDAATRAGDDAGGFFARAFETAASRAIGAGMIRVFGAGIAALVTSATPLGTVFGGGAAALVALTSAIAGASGAAVSLLGVLGSLGLVMGAIKVGSQGLGDAWKAQSKALEELRIEGEISTATQEKLDAALKNLAPSAAAVVTQLAAMAPAWEAVRRNVQQNLFARVAESIATLGRVYLPILSKQLGTAAASLSIAGNGLAAFLSSGARAAQINGIFTGLNRILLTLLAPLTTVSGGFLDLFQASLPFAQQLANVLSSLGVSFGQFLSQSVASGAFAEFMQNATTLAADLFRLLGNIGSIIGSVFGAGQAAGASLLDILGDLTGQLSQFLNSAAGQEALAGFFDLIGQAGQVLVGVFTTLSPLLSGIGALFSAMQPALQQLGAALVPVIAQLSAGLGTALTQLGPLFAQLVVALTPLVTTILDVLVTQFITLVPVIVQIVAGIIPLVSALVSGLVPAFQAFLPLSAQLAPILLQVAQAFLAALLPSIQAIVPLIPMLVTSALQLVSALISLLPSLIPLIGPAAELSLAFTNLLLALAPLIPPLVQIAVITITQVAPALTALVGFIVPVITSFTNLVNKITEVVSAIVGFVSRALSLFAQFRAGGADAISSLAATVVALVGSMISSVLGQLSGWVSSAVEIAGRVGTGIVNAVKSGLSGLAGAFRAPFDAAREAVSGAIEGIVSVVSGAVDRITGLVSRITGALGKIQLPGGIGNIDIPGFARGAIVDRPTLGVFGEAGKEALIPLTNKDRAAELMDRSGLTQLALERLLGSATVSSSGGGKTREIHMPVTVAGLTKEETIQILKDFLVNTFGGSRIGLDLGNGVTL